MESGTFRVQLQKPATGKQPREHPNQASWESTLTEVNAHTIQHGAAYISGKINYHQTQLLLHSRASSAQWSARNNLC